MVLKNHLFILFTKIVNVNPYLSLILLKMVYVVVPKNILEKTFNLLRKK